MDSLNYLVKKIRHLGEEISIADLDTAEREQLISYMKKKKMKFELNGDVLVVTKMTSATIEHIFRYFTLGTGVKEIYIDLLYECWNKKDVHDKRYFFNMVDKHLMRLEGEYFTYQDKLIIKKLTPKINFD